MTAKELLNLIDWLRDEGFANDKIIDCLERVEGRKNVAEAIVAEPVQENT